MLVDTAAMAADMSAIASSRQSAPETQGQKHCGAKVYGSWNRMVAGGSQGLVGGVLLCCVVALSW